MDVFTQKMRIKFQSTPPRKGRRCMDGLHGIERDVSIHAPTKGATTMSAGPITSMSFQSTPPREGRLACGARTSQASSFNPRPHERGDLCERCHERPAPVSIHAPTKGATYYRCLSCTCRCCFNPRPHERGDNGFLVELLRMWVSIHAPTKGATLYLT